MKKTEQSSTPLFRIFQNTTRKNLKARENRLSFNFDRLIYPLRVINYYSFLLIKVIHRLKVLLLLFHV